MSGDEGNAVYVCARRRYSSPAPSPQNMAETLLCFCFLLISTSTLVSGQYQPNWDSLDSRPLPKWYDQSNLVFSCIGGSMPSQAMAVGLPMVKVHGFGRTGRAQRNSGPSTSWKGTTHLDSPTMTSPLRSMQSYSTLMHGWRYSRHREQSKHGGASVWARQTEQT